jgi:ribosome recycling factor
MATIIPHPAIRPRSLVNVLADIREAKRDLDDALADVERGEEDGEDRANEAETRLEDLRDEFDVRFSETTGLTWKQLQTAVEEAVL